MHKLQVGSVHNRMKHTIKFQFQRHNVSLLIPYYMVLKEMFYVLK